MKFLKSNWPFLILFLVILIVFRHFVFLGRLPIPSDTIVGLYHPFRDLYSEKYPNGIPFKNFLITDPVRQTYPWRELSIALLKNGEIPFWNPYNMAGSPLLANFQSGTFYPLNITFFFLPFPLAWSIFILLSPFFAGFFMYCYLRNLGVGKVAGLLGSLTFSLSGFSIAWLTWGTVLHVILWLPLALFAIDKIFKHPKKRLVWSMVLIFSLTSSFFAGHLQTFFYLFILSTVYVVARWLQYGRKKKILLQFTIYYLLFIIITAIQWIPTLQFIFESARDIDLNWQKPGWFIPWQNLAQFIAPDFFGNPSTLNYFGIFNYAEFVGYIGILPLLFSILALLFRCDKKTLFFGGLTFVALLFALQNPISELPYKLKVPLLSTIQPTRLLGIVDFSLAVLASLGLDFLSRNRSLKRLLSVFVVVLLAVVALWLVALTHDLSVSKRNLILPTMLFSVSAPILLLLVVSKNKIARTLTLCILIGITTFDLSRFTEKFTPFTNKEYLFPSTKTIEFLKTREGEEGPFRLMSLDNRIFPPNFSTVYRLQTVDGYDPLYLRRYGELIAASERGQPNIDPPFGFNRIITPYNYESKIIDLLGVKYVLSLSDLSSSKLKKVFQEGQTRVYENTHVFPRTFFVEKLYEVTHIGEREKAMTIMFREDFDLGKAAVIELEWPKDSLVKRVPKLEGWSIGKSEIVHYGENRVVVETENTGDGFLVLAETFYPTWRVKIDGKGKQIYRTDYNFRGVYVPKGKHKVEFYNTLL